MMNLKYSLGAFFLLSMGAFAQTQRIDMKVPMLYPEGVAYDKSKNVFYVSSVKTGTIGTVDQQGKYTAFFKSNDLISSFGMKVDRQGKLLWVAVSDPNPFYSVFSSAATLKKMARVIAIDISTAKKVRDINLAKLYEGKHFINDLCLDEKGNVYLTDSYSPVIYKVGSDGKASVFAENELFKAVGGGLNGIAVNGDGYLITVNNANGTILKVDIDNPKMVTKVKISQHFPGADGLLWDNEGNLILIQNKGVNKVFTIESSDKWVNAKIKSATDGNDRFAQPSTGVLVNGKIWALNSKLNELMDKTMPPSQEFSLQLAEFKTVN